MLAEKAVLVPTPLGTNRYPTPWHPCQKPAGSHEFSTTASPLNLAVGRDQPRDSPVEGPRDLLGASLTEAFVNVPPKTAVVGGEERSTWDGGTSDLGKGLGGCTGWG